MPQNKLRPVSKDEAFDALCFLQSLEPKDDKEAEYIECASIGLQKIIRKRIYCESIREETNAKHRERMLTDPDYRERVQRNKKNYQIRNKEAIRERKHKKYFMDKYGECTE